MRHALSLPIPGLRVPLRPVVSALTRIRPNGLIAMVRLTAAIDYLDGGLWGTAWYWLDECFDYEIRQWDRKKQRTDRIVRWINRWQTVTIVDARDRLASSAR